MTTDAAQEIINFLYQFSMSMVAGYALQNAPETFQRYLLVSPSLWWADSSLLKQAIQLANDGPQKGRNVFIAYGSEEEKNIVDTYGCEFIIVKRGERGQLLYDTSTGAKWEISAYPARVADPSGAGDAFCGGFLAGYRRTYDPLLAVLHGNISASLVVEGSSPFYALEALPGLAEARLEALRNSVRKV